MPQPRPQLVRPQSNAQVALLAAASSVNPLNTHGTLIISRAQILLDWLKEKDSEGGTFA